MATMIVLESGGGVYRTPAERAVRLRAEWGYLIGAEAEAACMAMHGSLHGIPWVGDDETDTEGGAAC